jgi:hypothetical protein
MNSWRITKYNPVFRNNDGTYGKNTWTSISDIGNLFEDGIFTVEEYLQTENTYIDTVSTFMNYLDISNLRVVELEINSQECKKFIQKYPELYTDELTILFSSIKEGMEFDVTEIANLIRLILREHLWCKLESEKMFVHFGYDYYMYIGAKNKCEDVLKQIEHMNLFVEEYESPYN